MWIVDVIYHVLGGDSKCFLAIYAFHVNFQDFKTIQGHTYESIFLFTIVPACFCYHICVTHMHDFIYGNIFAPAVIIVIFVVYTHLHIFLSHSHVCGQTQNLKNVT